MFFFGCLALLQISVIPGLIIIPRFVKGKPVFYTVLLVFSSSLLTNFLLVFFLSAIHAYTFPVVLGLIFLEIAYLIYSNQSAMGRSIIELGNSFADRVIHPFVGLLDFNGLKPLEKFIKAILTITALIMAFFTIDWFVRLFVNNMGSVLSHWDTITAWNRWATEWAQNRIPSITWGYPQLLSSNWSLVYVLIRDSAGSFFIRAWQGIFPLLVIALVLGLAFKYKSYGILFAVTLTRLMYKRLATYGLDISVMFDGYIDVAVSSLSLAAFYIFLTDIKKKDYSSQTFWMSMLVASTAAAVKQAGIITWLAILAANLWAFREYKIFSGWKSFIRKTYLVVLVTGGIFAIWYLYGFIRAQLGLDLDVISMNSGWALSALNSGVIQSIQIRFSSLGIYLWLLFFILPGLFIKNKEIKVMTIVFIIPYLILSQFFGQPLFYQRYILPIIAPLAILVGVVLESVINYLAGILSSRINSWAKVWLGGIVLIGAMVVGVVFFRDADLHNNYLTKARDIYDPTLNHQLYSFLENKDPKEKVLSNYLIMDYLPGLETRRINDVSPNLNGFINETENANVKFILISDANPPDYFNWLNGMVNIKALKVIGTPPQWSNWYFYEIIDRSVLK